MNIWNILLANVVILFVGCRAPSVVPYRPGCGAPLRMAHAALLDARSKDLVPLNPEHSILYSQGFGGGGFYLEMGAGGIGILAGPAAWTAAIPPLAMQCNSMLISRITRREGAELERRIPIVPAVLFNRAAQKAGVTLDAEPGTQDRASPFLWLRKVDKKGTLVLFSGLILEPSSGADWRCRYLCEVPLPLSLAQLIEARPEDWNTWAPAIEEGFAAILKFIASPAPIGPMPRVKVSQALVPPRFPFRRDPELLLRDEKRIWVLRPEGVYGLQIGRGDFPIQ